MPGRESRTGYDASPGCAGFDRSSRSVLFRAPAMIAYHSDQFELPLPPGHRFPMAKYARLRERLSRAPAIELCVPEPATDDQLLTVHTPDYIARVTEGRLRSDEVRRIGFPWSPGLVERSRRSVGATLSAARVALVDGVAANLAGGTHHASADRGQGYCVFNDAAVTIGTLRAEGLVGRAAVWDCDVHHGNGTAAIFAGADDVMTVSLHGAKDFPAIKPPSTLDLPLARGTDDAGFLHAVRIAAGEITRSHWDEGRFDLMVYLAGADPLATDSLGSLAVSKAGLRERDRLVFETAVDLRTPVAVCMGGGYSPRIDDIVDAHAATVLTAARYADPIAAAVAERNESLRPSPAASPASRGRREHRP